MIKKLIVTGIFFGLGYAAGLSSSSKAGFFGYTITVRKSVPKLRSDIH